MPKFSVVVIAKNEEKTLPRLLNSLQEFKDRGGIINILDTGSTDKTVELATSFGCKVEAVGKKFVFTISEEQAKLINEKFVAVGESDVVKGGDEFFNYSEARNYCTSLASNNVVFYFDADEVAVKMDIDKIDKLIEEGCEQFEYNFVFAYDKWGNEAVKFVQCKAYDRRKMQWTGIVHEVLKGSAKKTFLGEEIFKLGHYQNHETSRHSYLKGLAYDCYNNPTNDRNCFYFARELMYLGRPHSALKEFQRHLSLNSWWKAERAETMSFIGDIYGQLNQPNEQAGWYFRATMEDPSQRTSWMKLARFYKHNNTPLAVASSVKAAMEIPWSGHYGADKANYENTPHELLYWAYGWMGNIPEAQKHILEALKYQPHNPEYLRDTKYYFEYGDPGIEGWMTYPDLLWLYEQGKKFKSIIEVGSWAGRSSHALLSGGMKQVPASAIICVDTWQGAKDPQDLTNTMAKQRDMLGVFKQNVGMFPNLTIIPKSSMEAAKDFADKSVECVFIDAGHTYEEVLQDIDAWLPKATKMLCGHDYLPNTWMGVVQAVDERFGKPDGVVDWIWYIDLEKRGAK